MILNWHILCLEMFTLNIYRATVKPVLATLEPAIVFFAGLSHFSELQSIDYRS